MITRFKYRDCLAVSLHELIVRRDVDGQQLKSGHFRHAQEQIQSLLAEATVIRGIEFYG